MRTVYNPLSSTINSLLESCHLLCCHGICRRFQHRLCAQLCWCNHCCKRFRNYCVTVAATVSAVVAATVAAIMQLDHLINMLKHGGGCNAGKMPPYCSSIYLGIRHSSLILWLRPCVNVITISTEKVTSLSLFVCLSVTDTRKLILWILTKFQKGLDLETRTNWLDFEGDTDPGFFSPRNRAVPVFAC